MTYFRKVLTPYAVYRKNQPQPAAIPPAFNGALGHLMDKYGPAIVANDNEIATPAIKYTAEGNFKEYYRATVPSADGIHSAALVNTTWCGNGPADLAGKATEFLIENAAVIAWRWPGDDEWDYDFEA